MKGLYSGRQILALKTQGKNITRSQTAVQAEKAIIRKYGSLSPEGKYFHVGKGNWNKYSLQNDKKRTGKLAASIEEWRERPHKLDFKGIDTKDGVSGKKPRFSVTSLKGSDKPTARKGKAVIQGTFSKAIDDWRVNKKIALTERRQKPVKKTVYEIYKNAGNGWKSVNVIIDNKLEADKLTKIQNEIEEKNKSGINFKVVPITSVTASHLPPNKYYTKLSLSALKHSGKLTSRNTKNQTAPKGYKPKTKIILSKAPKITIDQHFTKGKKSGSYAPTKTVNTPLEAFKIYMRHKDKYDEGLLFEAGPGSLTTAYEITTAARVDTPSVIYNAIIKKLNLDKYYAYLKYADDPMKLKTSPLRTLSLRGNWDRGAVL